MLTEVTINVTADFAAIKICINYNCIHYKILIDLYLSVLKLLHL